MPEQPTADLKTHLYPFVAVGLISAALGGWQVSQGADLPTWWPWLMFYAGLGVLLFGSSSLYHLAKVIEEPPVSAWTHRMNKLDHIGIHAIVAGTGTMHMAILPSINGDRVQPMLAVLWSLAAGGSLYRLVRGARVNGKLVMTLYGLMSATFLPVIATGEHLWDPAMCFTYAALAVYAFSVKVFFTKKELHGWWHVGTVVSYILAGVPIFLA